MNWILGIDTALSQCAGALYSTQTGECSESTLQVNRGFAEHLMPLLQDLFSERRISYQNLNGIVVTRGPGGFTGLRVGLSSARALGLALDIPVVGVSTAEAMLISYLNSEHQIDETRKIIVALESKRPELYIAVYDHDMTELYTLNSINSAQFMNEEIRQNSGVYTLIGDGADRFFKEVSQVTEVFKENRVQVLDFAYINIASVIKYSKGTFDTLRTYDNSIHFNPLYMRDADVSKSNMKQRSLADF